MLIIIAHFKRAASWLILNLFISEICEYKKNKIKIKKAMWLKRVTVFAGGDTSGQLICEIVRS